MARTMQLSSPLPKDWKVRDIEERMPKYIRSQRHDAEVILTNRNYKEEPNESRWHLYLSINEKHKLEDRLKALVQAGTLIAYDIRSTYRMDIHKFESTLKVIEKILTEKPRAAQKKS